jgi:hypothetical protein
MIDDTGSGDRTSTSTEAEAVYFLGSERLTPNPTPTAIIRAKSTSQIRALMI